MNGATRLWVGVCALAMSACSEWPPGHRELSQRFYGDREAFVQLEARLLETEYVQVSGGCVPESDRENVSMRVTLTKEVRDSVGEQNLYEQEYVNDDDWTDLFCRTSVWAAEKHDGAVGFDIGSRLDRNSKEVFAWYIHSQEKMQALKPCLPEFKTIPCGLCSLELDGGWYVEYSWSPEELVPGGFDRVLDEDISENEYYDQFYRNLDQCRKSGYSKIGYEPDMLQDR